MCQFRPRSARNSDDLLTFWHSRTWVSGLLLAAIAVGGCATVAPYERERLARRDMNVTRGADARAGQEHATAFREGSGGATGATGGGCGCN